MIQINDCNGEKVIKDNQEPKELELSKLLPKDEALLETYLESREVNSCEYDFITLLLWDNRYDAYYYISKNFLLIFESYEGETFALMPICEEKYFEEAFAALKNHFRAVGKPIVIYVADHVFAHFIEAKYGGSFEISTNRNESDYLYDAEALRTLAGKKLRKKRNHLNAFHKEYEGRWQYSRLQKTDQELICAFLRRWAEQREETEEMLEQELKGICKLIQHMDEISVKIAGIYIDGQLEALTMGSTKNHGKEGIIHIEKANSDIRGLYQLINQQFLIHEFPDIDIVNREDDVGSEGLRKAKMSYYPIGFAEKFNIREICND